LALLEVSELSVSFGDSKVLADVSFSVDKGERFGIIGESGSGKTMTALAVMGLLPEGASATGRISFDGAVLPEDEALRAKLRGRRIGLVFQEPMTSLNPLERVGTQVIEAMQLAERDGDLRA